MEGLQGFFLIVQLVVAVLIVVLVLLQPSGGGDGLTTSSNIGGGIVSGRSAASFLTKFTMILAAIFMLNTLFLGVIASKKSAGNSIVNELIEKEKDNSVPLAK